MIVRRPASWLVRGRGKAVGGRFAGCGRRGGDIAAWYEGEGWESQGEKLARSHGRVLAVNPPTVISCVSLQYFHPSFSLTMQIQARTLQSINLVTSKRQIYLIRIRKNLSSDSVHSLCEMSNVSGGDTYSFTLSVRATWNDTGEKTYQQQRYDHPW